MNSAPNKNYCNYRDILGFWRALWRSVKKEILHWSYKSCLGHAWVMLSSYQVKLEVNEIVSAVNSMMTQSNDQI